jgi:hypothetical protein
MQFSGQVEVPQRLQRRYFFLRLTIQFSYPASTAVLLSACVFISSVDQGRLGIEIPGLNAENDPDRVSIPFLKGR